MGGYSAFAKFYDRLMRDIDYASRAEYLLGLFERHGKAPSLMLDLACGSGSLALQFISRGIDVIGVDKSRDMLSLAREKADKRGESLLLLCQDMRRLDLYGTVEGAVCCLDGINHICDTKGLSEVFSRLFLFIEPGGLFVFDVNTVYKHRFVLADNAFVFEQDDFVCIWRNRFIKGTFEVDMRLDFFKKEKGCYARFSESLRERAYSESTIKRLLTRAGFETLAVYDDMSTDMPKADSSRLVFVARRKTD